MVSKERPKPSKHAPSMEMLNLGLHFIGNSIDDLEKVPGSDLFLQSAILDLFTGLEILVKALLVRKDWPYVFENLDLANELKYLDGDFKSVTYSNALIRLENLLEIKFSAHQVKLLDSLRKRRNGITHSGKLVGHDKLKDETINALGIVLGFTHRYFDTDVERATCFEYQKRYQSKCLILDGYKEHRLEALAKSHPRFYPELTLRCYNCLQESIVIEQGLVTCHVCDAFLDDYWILYLANSCNPPAKFNSSSTIELSGCCNGDCIGFGDASSDPSSSDFTVKQVICLYCGNSVAEGRWSFLDEY